MKILKIKEYLKERSENSFTNMDPDSLNESLTNAFAQFVSAIDDDYISVMRDATGCPVVMLRTKLDPLSQIFPLSEIYKDLIESMSKLGARKIILKGFMVTSPIYTPDSFKEIRGIMARLKYI